MFSGTTLSWECWQLYTPKVKVVNGIKHKVKLLLAKSVQHDTFMTSEYTAHINPRERSWAHNMEYIWQGGFHPKRCQYKTQSKIICKKIPTHSIIWIIFTYKLIQFYSISVCNVYCPLVYPMLWLWNQRTINDK